MRSPRRLLIFVLVGLLVLLAVGVGAVYILFSTGFIRVEQKLSPGVD